VLIKLRCDNLENANKYWLNEEHWRCVFCEKGKDSIKHYVREGNKVKVWFRKLGSEKRDILGKLWGEEDLDRLKRAILKKLCKEREKKIRAKERKKKQRLRYRM